MGKMKNRAIGKMNEENHDIDESSVLGPSEDAKVYLFLDDLRASGAINMWLAPAEIRNAFHLDDKDSGELFFRWKNWYGSHVKK